MAQKLQEGEIPRENYFRSSCIFLLTFIVQFGKIREKVKGQYPWQQKGVKSYEKMVEMVGVPESSW